ncbi:hypothetical protein AaE_009895, partial [Aphanomyces astaci]
MIIMNRSVLVPLTYILNQSQTFILLVYAKIWTLSLLHTTTVCGGENSFTVPPVRRLVCSSNSSPEVDSKREQSNSSAAEVDPKQRQIDSEEKPSTNLMMAVPAPTAVIPEPTPLELGAIYSINQTIDLLDWDLVDKQLQKGKAYFLRDATLSEWEAYVTTEDQQLKSKNMEWIDGKLFIVELPSRPHERYIARLIIAANAATHTGLRFLDIAGAAYQTNIRRLEPDVCLMPRRVLEQPPYNVQLPPGVNWIDFHTVKFEVGWFQSWDQLDRKANQWETVVNVVYIVCIQLDYPTLAHCSYKVHHVVHHGVALPAMVPI